MGAGRLSGRVAIVTGAGRGIGFSVARSLCREGAKVVIGELVEERGSEAAARLAGEGYEAEAHPLDVRDPASSDALIGKVVARHGAVDILVNNAGLGILDRSEAVPEKDWRIQVDVMLSGVFFVSQAAARVMIPRKRGSIVNIASTGGLGGWPMRAAYNAAKAGVVNLTETLGTEWAQYGIRVNSVSPGVTRTEMVADAIRDGFASEKRYADRTPLRRLADVQEIANAVLFLASDRASFITGTNLRVDGGWVAWGNPCGEGFPEETAHG